MPLVTTGHAVNRQSRRTPISAAVTGVAATDIITVPAGFLDDLQNGDIVGLSALTGGAGLTATDYYICGLACQPAAGATTCQLSSSVSLAPVDFSSDLTVCTMTKGTALSGQGESLPSPLSARGR